MIFKDELFEATSIRLSSGLVFPGEVRIVHFTEDTLGTFEFSEVKTSLYLKAFEGLHITIAVVMSPSSSVSRESQSVHVPFVSLNWIKASMPEFPLSDCFQLPEIIVKGKLDFCSSEIKVEELRLSA
jgi:hypothetical protein